METEIFLINSSEKLPEDNSLEGFLKAYSDTCTHIESLMGEDVCNHTTTNTVKSSTYEILARSKNCSIRITRTNLRELMCLDNIEAFYSDGKIVLKIDRTINGNEITASEIFVMQSTGDGNPIKSITNVLGKREIEEEGISYRYGQQLLGDLKSSTRVSFEDLLK